MKKSVFKQVVEFLYLLQQKQPLNEISFYPGMDIDMDVYDLYECLLKLQKDYLVVKEIFPNFMFVYPYSPQDPYPYSGYNEYNMWEVSLEENFPKWAEEFLFKRKKKEESLKAEILYTADRNIILNNQFLIAKPNFNSENDLIFNFLFRHPYQSFSRKEIESEIGIKLFKDFDKIVENLGFKKDLRRIFFDVSKDKISFRNPVTGEQLKQMKIDYIKI